MNRRLILSLAAVLAIGACSEQQEPNSNPTEFASVGGSIGVNVILKAPATAANRAELAKFGTLMDEIAVLNAIRVKTRMDQLPAIQALPFVAAAGPDAVRDARPIDAVAVTDFVGGISTWDQDAINVTDFGAGRTSAYDGSGVYVAILDTGLLPTWRQYFPQERIATQYAKSFGGGGQDRGNVSEQPNKWESDVNSHGTHVTSTVLGYQMATVNPPRLVNGTAPRATIIPVKVLNQNGSGWSSVIAHGILYVTHLKQNVLPANTPVVINMSLGGPSLDPLEEAAINQAVAAGVILVASAGNGGNAGMGYPGAFAPVISVAASGWIGEWVCNGTAFIATWWRTCDVPEGATPAAIASNFYIADFSSREKPGQDLDVAAPGSWVVGPYQVNQSNRISFFFLGGTSMASPHVAGIVALMAQKHPALTAPQAEGILESTAIPLGAGSRNIFDPNIGPTTVTWGTDATGHGLATADAALAVTPSP